MAWGDSTSLKFDLSKIEEIRRKIQDTAVELTDFKTTLLQEVENLKRDWRTAAGRKFAEKFDTDWAKQVEQYVKIIEAVDRLLEVAENNYRNVEEEANKISF